MVIDDDSSLTSIQDQKESDIEVRTVPRCPSFFHPSLSSVISYR